MTKQDRIRGLGPIGVLGFLRHLPNFVRLYWRLWKDRRVSDIARAALVLGFLYVLLPFDIVGDWFPALGQLDDLAVIALSLRAFIALSPRDVVREHVAAIDSGRPGVS